MLDRDQVRLAAALAHAVTGAELRAQCPGGDELVVSRHPAADLSPCVFRQLVVSATGRDAGSCPHIDAMDIGGAVGDLGGGVFRSRSADGAEERWLGSILDWRIVRALLDGFARDHSVSEELEATVAPDSLLGVTLVRLDARTSGAAMDIDRIAAALSAVLLVEEMLQELITPLDAGRVDGER